MGGVASAIAKPLVEDVAEGGIKNLTHLLTSSEAVLKESKGGTVIYDMLDKVLQNTAKETEQHLNPNGKSVLHDIHTFTDPVTKVTRPTTAAEKVQLGAANKKLMDAAHATAMQQNQAVFLGPKRTYITRALAQAKAEKDIFHANAVRDIVSTVLQDDQIRQFKKGGVSTNWMSEAGVRPYISYKRPDSQGLEKKARDFMGLTYLSQIVLPHLMQPINTALTMGIKPWAEAVAEIGSNKKEMIDFTTKTGVWFSENYREMKAAAEGKDTLFNKLIHMPGFQQVRKYQIMHAAVTGKLAAEDAFEDVMRGKKSAEILYKTLGLDPAEIRAQGRLTEDNLLRAGYKSADENLFLNRGLKTPATWDKDMGWRMATMYKHFQFREGKLIKDSVVKALKSNDAATVARTFGILGVMFPIAGELISSMKNLATGRNPFDRSQVWHPAVTKELFGDNHEYVDEYLDAMGHMAAFGIWYSLFRAVLTGRQTDYMAGPMVGLASDAARSGVAASKGNFKPAFKSAARRVPVIGPAIAAHVDDISGAVSDTIDNLTN